MLTVVAFWWTDKSVAHKARYAYTKKDVELLFAAVRKNLSIPHECVVVTDKPEQFAGSDIRAVPLDRTTWVDGTRYAKLQLFGPDAEKTIGGRILYLDLDSVVVRDLAPLVDRDEDLVLWRNPNFGIKKRAFYNTSIILLRAGSRQEFWLDFDPKKTPAEARRIFSGTDQAYISIKASRNEAHWTSEDGVYGSGRIGDIVPGVGTTLPENARVVMFPGKRRVDDAAELIKHPWIKQFRSSDALSRV